jgi:hypothetical protein
MTRRLTRDLVAVAMLLLTGTALIAHHAESAQSRVWQGDPENR